MKEEKVEKISREVILGWGLEGIFLTSRRICSQLIDQRESLCKSDY